jgi:hypothetical protein
MLGHTHCPASTPLRAAQLCSHVHHGASAPRRAQNSTSRGLRLIVSGVYRFLAMFQFCCQLNTNLKPEPVFSGLVTRESHHLFQKKEKMNRCIAVRVFTRIRPVGYMKPGLFLLDANAFLNGKLN